MFDVTKCRRANARARNYLVLYMSASSNCRPIDSIAASKDLSDENAGKLKSVVESVAKSIG